MSAAIPQPADAPVRSACNLIRECQVPQLQTVMQTSSRLGMHTLDQSLQRLVRRGLVHPGAASAYASDRGALAVVIVGRDSPAGAGWPDHLNEAV